MLVADKFVREFINQAKVWMEIKEKKVHILNLISKSNLSSVSEKSVPVLSFEYKVIHSMGFDNERENGLKPSLRIDKHHNTNQQVAAG